MDASAVTMLENWDPDAIIRAAVAPVAQGEWCDARLELTEVRKQGRKRIAFALLHARETATSRPVRVPLVVKQYGSDEGSLGYQAMVSLWEAGFQPPATSIIPQPFGYSPAHGTLLQGVAAGTVWTDSVTAAPATRAVNALAVADWVAALQHSGVSAPRNESAKIPSLATVAERLLLVEGTHTIASCALAVSQKLATNQAPAVASHGNFHPKNVFVNGNIATVFDFDTFGAREPAFDVGHAMAQLLATSAVRVRSLSPGMQAAELFWSRYQDAGGSATWDRVKLHVARMLIHNLHYRLRMRPRASRIDLIEPWTKFTAICLDGSSEYRFLSSDVLA